MTGEDTVYAGLLVDDAHWAFGGEFDDPLAGVDTTVPDGVDPAVLAAYSLALGDDALVMAQRLSEWCSRAPDLELDIALANVSLDLLGQARLLLARAAAADASLVPALPEASPVPDEDRLAFFRDAPAFANVRLVELPRGDLAETMARLLLFSTWRLALLQRLAGSRDAVLAAVGAKGVTEVTYHRDLAARWCVTLAHGTEESRRRLVAGLDASWPWWSELVATRPVEAAAAAAGVGVDPAQLVAECDDVLAQVLEACGLSRPEQPAASPDGCGRDGEHTDALGALLAEMQVVARAHPEGRW